LLTEKNNVDKDTDLNVKNEEDDNEDVEDSERKAVSCGIKEPGVVVWTFHARVKPDGFSWQFSSGKSTGVRQGAVGLTLNITFGFPFLKISQRIQVSRFLDPFENLYHIKEIDIIMLF